MKLLTLLLALSSLTHPSVAHLEDADFPGYGFSWYDPVCGFACNNAISGAPLECNSDHAGGGHSHMDMGDGPAPPSPACRAHSAPFLTTLAYCMSTYCDAVEVPTWRRERFWVSQVTGDEAVLPMWDYSRALEEVGDRPTVEFNGSSKSAMNQTVVVGKATYEMQSKFMVKFDRLEMLQPKYIFVLITIGFGTPVFFTLLTKIPFMTGILDKIKPYLVYPSSIGTYYIRPLPWLIGNAPTIGQALYIFLFFLLNLVLSAVNYTSSQPHPWYFGPREEMLSYIGYRTGHIGYALLPLLILFSSRNNFLLWITNWSYSTYILLHRWVARIFAVQAIIHSVTLLACYKGVGSYPVESTQPYWLWGIVATVLTCAMLVFSHLYFRRAAYEVFLILHILLAVFFIVGCWYHVVLRWGNNFYDNWLYAACAVWFADRLMRVLRVLKNGVRRAVVTEIGGEYVRVDIQGLRWASKPGHVGYAYFPTLKPLMPWENHPFSVNSTALFRSYKNVPAPGSATLERTSSDDSGSGSGSGREEKSADVGFETGIVNGTVGPVGTTGITLIIKKNTGLTRLLKSNARLLTLLDGPYPLSHSTGVLKCDRLLLIGGGIGITGLAAWVRAHPNVKLAWSVRASAAALAKEMDDVLREAVDRDVRVGERLDIEALLRKEAEAGYEKVGVVVCGPGGMCDEVRARVAGLGRAGKTVFELEVDAFSW